jgi:hypothetical protein
MKKILVITVLVAAFFAAYWGSNPVPDQPGAAMVVLSG